MPGPWEAYQGEASSTPAAGPWEKFGGADDGMVTSHQRDTITQPTSLLDKAIDIPKRTAKNAAAVVDTALSFPGAVIGPLAGATARWVAIAKGAGSEDVSSFGSEFGNNVQSKLSEPIQKIMEAVGYEGGYKDSEVSHVLNKVGEVVGKGADWLSKKSGMNPEDAQDLVNAGTMLLAPGAVRLTAKALVKTGEVMGKAKRGEAAEAPTLRSLPEDKPAPPKPDATPASLAKQHIEESTGVAAEKAATPEYQKARRADARAAFAEDPQYADYLRNYAEEEVRQRTAVNELAADKVEAEVAEEPPKPEPLLPPSMAEVEPILKKPGFQRTPEELVKLRNFNKQGGQASPELLAKMAAVGLGVTAGLALDPDHPIEGALLGALGGFGASKVALNPKAAVGAIKSAFGTDKRIRITEAGDAHEVAVERAGRAIWQRQNAILADVASPERRAAVTNWLQGDHTIPLTAKEYKAALAAKSFFDEMGKAGVELGVLSHLIPDYVTNLWDLEGTNKAVWGKLGTGMSEQSRFNLQRKIVSIAEGKKLGLKPVTEDVARIMGIYGNSLSKTMANRRLMETLRDTTLPDEGKLLLPAAEAPKNFVPVDHPQMKGQLVHPDIAPSLRFMFQQSTPKGILAGIEGINTALKRNTVSLSLFHARALTDAFVGAGGNPFKIPGMVNGSSKLLTQLREGGAGDMVDKALEGGLKFTLEQGKLADEDVGGAFYSVLDRAGKAMDEVVPGSGKLVEKYKDLNHAVDKFMWERLHAGMKLEIFSKNYERLLRNNVEAHEANPLKVPLKTSKEISRIASSFTNDVFGGLNWRRAAEEARTQIGRDVALSLYSPAGRRGMQLLMFAPDWTISTTRAALKAAGPGSGLKGLVKPQELADLHRQYIARNIFYYLTAANAVNYMFSGHSVLENKDKTTIELGDGRTTPISKHAFEPVHWITKTKQQALNKLGALPSEFTEQVAGVEYLSASGSAPKIEPGTAAHARHMLKRLIPISVGQSESGFAEGVSGALGFPVYGRTEEQKAADRARRRDERRKAREKALEDKE